jgi:hypothetical protein
MNITNKIMAGMSSLTALLGDAKQNHVGYVYAMSFTEAMVLTNDEWKERVAGIPQNSFLVAAAFNPEKFAETHEFDREVVLLRVIGPANLPFDADLIKTRIEHNQRRTADEIFTEDVLDGLDPMTHGELQYGALKCRVLGTFFVSCGQLWLGSDLENFVSSTHLRVFKPRGEALHMIVNHINPDVLAKSLEDAKKSGFAELPTPIKIGEVRYTSTDRLHRGGTEPRVDVMVQPSDFLARRTAVFGMTRTGKSNTVKTMVAAVHLAAMQDGVKVGQVIFDLNGEYANATSQDDNSSIARVFADDTIRYRGIPTTGFLDMRNNFYTALDEGLQILQSELSKSGTNSGQDMQTLMSLSLDKPIQASYMTVPEFKSAETRWKKTVAIYKSILRRSEFQQGATDSTVTFPVGEDVLDIIFNSAYSSDVEINAIHGGSKQKRTAYVRSVLGDPSSGITLDEAVKFFSKVRELNKGTQIVPRNGGEPWLSKTDEGLLNLLVGKSDGDGFIRSTRVIGNAGKPYHSPQGSDNVPRDIYGYLLEGKIVIVDLSVGVESVRKTAAERIASHVLSRSMDTFASGAIPPKVMIYVEEAHNLIGKDANFDTTWPRIAKEGAKAGIALVYSTQEPSSVHPNILANTENWFTTHLNNDDELKALGKFYDFVDFKDSLKLAQNIGFARIKTMSSPFVVPTQIERFTPEILAKRLAAVKDALSTPTLSVATCSPEVAS